MSPPQHRPADVPASPTGDGDAAAATAPARPSAPAQTPRAGAADPSRSRDHLRATRRDELLDAAERAVRSDGPDVSMEALAAEAGITKPILYRHFRDRSDLFGALARRYATRLVARLREALADQPDPRERIRTTIQTYLALLEDDPELHRVASRVERAGDAPGALEDALTVISAEVTGNVERELRAAGVATDAAATWGTAIVGMAQLVGHRWLEAPDASRSELAERLTDLVWQGFAGIVRTRGTARDT